MNLSQASEVTIGGKSVDSIDINGERVWDYLYMLLTANKSYILTGETVTVTFTCEKLANKDIDLYKVIGLTRTKLDTLTTDSNGQASYTYTGVGDGEIGFVAVYDESDSNMVMVDDYTPAVTSVGLASTGTTITYGTSVTFTATVKDQHNQNITSGTVTFKDGSTTLGTGSISNGVATYTANLNAGSHSITAEISNVTSSAVSITVGKANTSTSIVPPTLVYSDEFDVTGTLKTSGGEGIVGATVTLLWNDGTDHTATTTTGTGGAYSFHRDAPTTIRAYTFKVVFAGDSNCNGSESSDCSVNVGKETSVLNVTSPVNNSGVFISGTVSIAGTLKDNDNTAMTGKSVLVKLGNTTLTTLTTDSNGAFSGTVSASSLDEGSNDLTFQFVEETNYTGASATRTVTVSSYDSIGGLSKSAGKDILSYADYTSVGNTEYCTVQATLKADGQTLALSGVSIDFVVVDGQGTVLETLGTVDTVDGVAEYTYESEGAGDVILQATDGILLSETYSLQDCLFYDSQTVDKQRYTVTTGGANISYSSDGVTIAGTQATDSLVKNTALSLPNSYSAEVTLTKLSGYVAGGQTLYGGLCFDNCLIDMTSVQITIYTLSPIASLTTINQRANQGDVLKIEMDNGTMKIYINDVLKTTQSISHTGIHQHRTYKPNSANPKSITAKDLKVKPL